MFGRHTPATKEAVGATQTILKLRFHHTTPWTIFLYTNRYLHHSTALFQNLFVSWDYAHSVSGGSTLPGRVQGASDAHGHYDVAVATGFVAKGAELAGGLLVFQFETDGAIGGGAKEIQQVLRVETDGDRLAVEFLLNCFFGFAVFRAGRGNFQAFLGEHELHGMRPLVGELRNAAQ